MMLLHCMGCHHEWEGKEGAKCDWCGCDSRVLEKTTPLGRMVRALFGDSKMSKRAIICFCGLAKPCDKPDCQHTSAIVKRNEAIKRANREARIKRARTALSDLHGPEEWGEVLQHYCRECGGPPECYCTRDD